MRVFGRLGPVTLGLFVVVGVACKDSGAPAVVVSSLSRVSGDSQATLTGNPLNNPLTVRVTGSNGQPFAGATVTWTVSAGAATLGSPTAPSDSQGFASTTVTLGATPGAIGFQASVGSGVTPVSFGATACDHPVLALNDTIPGALAASDCKFNGFFTDFYDVSVPTGPQGLELTMASGAFDTWLELYLQNGAFLGFDDDIDSLNTNSQLTAIVAPGEYLLAPSSYQPLITGSYTMAALSRPAQLAGCGIVWVTRGVSLSDSVTAGDCVDSTNGVYYADVVAMYLLAGTTLTVSNQSTAFDAALFLHNAAGASVASNNDSANAGTTQNAYLVYPVTASGPYLLFAGTNTTASTGAYTLSISAATTLSASARREEGPQLLRMGGLRLPKGRSRRAWSRAGR
jgi:hypothetical protein